MIGLVTSWLYHIVTLVFFHTPGAKQGARGAKRHGSPPRTDRQADGPDRSAEPNIQRSQATGWLDTGDRLWAAWRCVVVKPTGMVSYDGWKPCWLSCWLLPVQKGVCNVIPKNVVCAVRDLYIALAMYHIIRACCSNSISAILPNSFFHQSIVKQISKKCWVGFLPHKMDRRRRAMKDAVPHLKLSPLCFTHRYTK